MKTWKVVFEDIDVVGRMEWCGFRDRESAESLAGLLLQHLPEGNFFVVKFSNDEERELDEAAESFVQNK